jgi:glutathione S-transferase
MLKLYHHSTSVCSSKVRFVLAEKNRDYAGVIVDLIKGEQHAPEYLKLNPKGVVPTLIHDDHVIVESNVICEYLDDVFPSPRLRPESPFDCARMRLWMKQLDEDVHEFTSVISTAIAFRYMRLKAPREQVERSIASIPDVARRERMHSVIFEGIESRFMAAAMKRFVKLLSDMQTCLEDETWLAGESFSLADIALVPYITRLYHLRLDFLLAPRPQVQDWYGRIREMENYKTSHLDWYDGDAIVELMRSKGAELSADIEARFSAV